MRNGKLLFGIIFILVAALLSGCQIARVKIKDREWCANGGEFGAECFYTLSTKERHLTPAQYQEWAKGKYTTHPDTLTEMNIVRETLCEDTGRCDYEDVKNDVKQFDAFYKRAKRARQRASDGLRAHKLMRQYIEKESYDVFDFPSPQTE